MQIRELNHGWPEAVPHENGGRYEEKVSIGTRKHTSPCSAPKGFDFTTMKQKCLGQQLQEKATSAPWEERQRKWFSLLEENEVAWEAELCEKFKSHRDFPCSLALVQDLPWGFDHSRISAVLWCGLTHMTTKPASVPSGHPVRKNALTIGYSQLIWTKKWAGDRMGIVCHKNKTVPSH